MDKTKRILRKCCCFQMGDEALPSIKEEKTKEQAFIFVKTQDKIFKGGPRIETFKPCNLHDDCKISGDCTKDMVEEPHSL